MTKIKTKGRTIILQAFSHFYQTSQRFHSSLNILDQNLLQKIYGKHSFSAKSYQDI